MIVFTRKSLPKYIEIGQIQGFGKEVGASPISDDLALFAAGGHSFLIHSDDDLNSKMIMVAGENWPMITGTSDEVTSRFLERINRAARAMARPPVSLPPQWSKFSYENLLTFFATPKNFNSHSLRWVAESLPEGNVCFWEMTDRSNPKPLQTYRSDHSKVASVIDEFPNAVAWAMEEFAGRAPQPKLVQPSIDLERVGGASIVKNHTYSEWLPLLTQSQHSVLVNELHQPLKIRGIAGTGKTLILQLKALKELYREADSLGASESLAYPRILFLTHSWAMAQQVEATLERLDDRGQASQIEVMPLTYLREWLQGSLPPNVEVLGEDSLDGKQQQMRLIGEAIDHILTSTWETYRQDVSEWVRESVESESSSEARLSLCWALMREFAEVFDSHEIKPGRNALRKYLGLPRENWMVPLSRGTDRELAFAVYRYYVQRLAEEGQLTTDQLVDDFRRYLQTYIWNAERAARGYDIILVDEFHLFSDSERYLLHLLTRDVEEAPRLIMAMDPSQSAFTLLTGLSEGEISRGSRGILQGSETEAIDLTVAHRFTPPIFSFVQYLHSMMPNLVELGHDWVYDSFPSSSSEVEGGVPCVKFFSRERLASEAVAEAFSIQGKIGRDSRLALIGVGKTDLEAIKRALLASGHPSSSFVLIEGRDDIELLRYSRHALIITTAEYAAGLQFSHVIVAAGATGSFEYGHGASAMRAFYSQFYLAASRAEENLIIFAPEDAEFADLLNRGIEAGLIRE